MANEKTVVRVTKAQKFEVIKSLIPTDAVHTFHGNEDKADYVFDYNEMMAFLEKELKLLAKKNSGDSKKQTEAQKLNASIKEELATFLGGLDDGDLGMTCTEIIKAKGWLADYSVSKISSLLRQLKDEGRVVSKTVKGKTLFTLA